MTPATTFTDWGAAIIASAATALALFFAAIPKIIGFVLILIIGWLIASAIASIAAAFLRTVHFDDLARRSGFAGFVHNMGVQNDSSGFLADIVKWFVRLIVLVTAFDALGLPAVSQVLQSLLLWLPNLVVALVVLVIAGLAANAVHGMVRGATAESGFGNPDLLANVAKFAVLAFGVVVAVNQVGIATALVNTLFMATVGAVALALGLAFGLGGRETAGMIVRGWYDRANRSGARIERAADVAQERLSEQAAPRPGDERRAA